ncbi:50S ribosomal protein L9 [Erysipelothrix rhusiopathiae SY1027]|uniref:Large ribosomal subunit protein bL9 n=2 Tax=Erysipelothrix TaxID=1647 RepID=E7FWY2_ERYRH|nr:50S ribosomal protein L9 [Erysipelothrix rhusiopathiae SY1027]EFY08681.1 ribosomal protein L9 [Erysipelothrix rhusiopathiae ATCC 19414]
MNNMKLILLKDVKKVGKKNDIVEVADGYARNFLLPNKLAVMASDQSREILDHQKQEHAAEVQAEIEKAKLLAKELEKITLEFKVKVGEGGRVFGSVSTKQVEDALKKEHKIKVDKRKFKPSGPITHLGSNRIQATLYGDVTGEIHVKLIAE